jgi:Fuc2NAc and GlcNAc transferase
LAFLLPVGVLLTAWSLTGLYRAFALRRELLDIPNARSSHVVAAPRGGGIAIAFSLLAAVVLLGALSAIPWRSVWGLLGAGAVVAAIGFGDDVGHIAPRWRLLAHFVAASWLLAWLGGLPPIDVFGHMLNLGWPGQGLAVLYIVWLVNLTNFMDGIDGIAAVEAITVSTAGAVLYVLVTPATDEWLGPVALAAAALGFLFWNWPPARIFMGDAGSGFIGLTLAALSLQAARAAPALLWSWIIMLGVFVVDATVTLVRRAARGDRFYEAHRSHAYQHAAERWHAHLPVTLTVAAINLLWLFPISVLVAIQLVDGLIGTVLAYVPLIAGALLLKAGRLSNTAQYHGAKERTAEEKNG